MIIKIKYKNPDNLDEFIIEELDDSIINVPQYCENLHKEKLCGENECDGENCKIWMEFNGEFILTGVYD
jgi:hypothetical protein